MYTLTNIQSTKTNHKPTKKKHNNNKTMPNTKCRQKFSMYTQEKHTWQFSLSSLSKWKTIIQRLQLLLNYNRHIQLSTSAKSLLFTTIDTQQFCHVNYNFVKQFDDLLYNTSSKNVHLNIDGKEMCGILQTVLKEEKLFDLSFSGTFESLCVVYTLKDGNKYQIYSIVLKHTSTVHEDIAYHPQAEHSKTRRPSRFNNANSVESSGCAIQYESSIKMSDFDISKDLKTSVNRPRVDPVNFDKTNTSSMYANRIPHRILDTKKMITHYTQQCCIFTINAYEYNRIVNTLCIMIGNDQGVIDIEVNPTSNKKISVIKFIATAHNGARSVITIRSHQLCPNNRLIRPVQTSFQLKILLTYIKLCSVNNHTLVNLHISPCGMLIETSDKVQIHQIKVFIPDVSNVDFNSYY